MAYVFPSLPGSCRSRLASPPPAQVRQQPKQPSPASSLPTQQQPGSGIDRTTGLPYMPRTLLEAEAQRQLLAWFDRVCVSGCVRFPILNGLPMSRKQAAIYAGQQVPGIPDLAFVHEGKIRFLEMKSEAGRLAENQIEMHGRLVAAGCLVATAYGLDQAQQQLVAWQLVRHGALVPADAVPVLSACRTRYVFGQRPAWRVGGRLPPIIRPAATSATPRQIAPTVPRWITRPAAPPPNRTRH